MTQNSSSHNYSQPLQSQTVTIYVRNFDKKAISLIVHKKIQIPALKNAIMKKMKIRTEDQILILNGSRIPDNLEELEVKDKHIFHIVDSKRVGLQFMTIYIRRIPRNSKVYEYKVSSEMRISNFMREKLSADFVDYDDYFLACTGRELMPFNTFSQELVENQSQLFCVHKVQDKKGQYINYERIPKRTLNLKNFQKQGKSRQIQSEQIFNKDFEVEKLKSTQNSMSKNKRKVQESKEATNNSTEQENIRDDRYKEKYGQDQYQCGTYDETLKRLQRIMGKKNDTEIDQQDYAAFVNKSSKNKSQEQYGNSKYSEFANQQPILKTQNSEQVIHIMNQRTNKNRQITNPLQSFEYQGQKLPQKPIFPKKTSKEQSDGPSPDFHLQTDRAHSETGYPAKPMKLLWDKLDDDKILFEMSSKIEEDKISMIKLFQGQSTLYEKQYGQEIEENVCRFGPNDLLMLGSQFSLGLEFIRDETYAEFQEAFREREMLNA